MNTQYVVRGLTVNGDEKFYTGRAGDGWVTTNATQAFCYDTIGEARRRATFFNQMTEVHGLRFIAIPDPCSISTDPMEDFNYRGSRYHY